MNSAKNTKYRWKCSNKIISFNTIKTCQEYRQNTQKTDILQVFLICMILYGIIFIYTLFIGFMRKNSDFIGF